MNERNVVPRMTAWEAETLRHFRQRFPEVPVERNPRKKTEVEEGTRAYPYAQISALAQGAPPKVVEAQAELEELKSKRRGEPPTQTERQITLNIPRLLELYKVNISIKDLLDDTIRDKNRVRYIQILVNKEAEYREQRDRDLQQLNEEINGFEANLKEARTRYDKVKGQPRSGTVALKLEHSRKKAYEDAVDKYEPLIQDKMTEIEATQESYKILKNIYKQLMSVIRA